MSITVEQAIEQIQKQVQGIKEYESVAIDEIEGRILGDDLVATMNQPPFPRSPLDGYALNSQDVVGASVDKPVVLRVIDTINAGECSHVKWNAKTAVRIMTGAPIPVGFDCVIRQEDTDYGNEMVEIYKEHKAYENYCYEGEDVKKGEILIKKNTKLNYIHSGIIASQGIPNVCVYQKPKVLLITTGSELVDITSPINGGEIYNTNLYTLKARLKSLGFLVDALAWLDEEKGLAEYIRLNHERFHCIITTGGVSVGVKDIIHDLQRELEEKPIFHGVVLKPGTPLMYWKYNKTPILSLSGNPFAAFATFELFARPMLSVIANNDEIMVRWTKGIMKDSFEKHSPKRRFIRAHYREGVVNLHGKNHSSGSFADTAYCNCLIDIEEGNKGLKRGEEVKVVLF